MQANDIYQAVAEDFEAVNTLIIEQLSSHVPMVEKIAHYIIESGGKRMRPLLVLLSANALGHKGKEPIALAAVIEFLHTATLLHDDVVDTSDMRRGRPTANANWGNAPSVLVGDFLYSRSFQMMVQLGNLKVMDILSDTTSIIAQGEVMQLMNVKNPNLTEEQYMEVIKGKTAQLFEASSHATACLVGASDDHIKALKDYGMHLGLAFQLIDDVLDYEGDAKTMGKNVGDDLAEGKTTLPLIYAMQNQPDAEAKLIRQAIRKGGLDLLDEVLEIVKVSGSIDYTRQQADKQAELAQACAEQLPPSIYRDALVALTHIAVKRDK
jgi:octaprenyl-diphosphate synthase